MASKTKTTKRALDPVLEAESLEWMLTQHPEFVDAIQQDLDSGMSPEDIKWHVYRRTDRMQIAKRCELVATWLVGE